MKNYWRNLSNLGINSDMPVSQIKRTILSNQLSILLFFFLLLLVTTLFLTGITESIWIELAAVFSLLLVPLVNSRGKVNLSAFLISVIMPAATLYFSTISKVNTEETNVSMYYFPRLLLLSEAIIPFVLLGKQKIYLLFIALAVNIGCLIGFDAFHEFMGVGVANTNLPPDQYRIINYLIFIPYGILMLGFSFLLYINDFFEKKSEELIHQVREKNKILRDQNNEIEAQRDLATKQRDQIAHQKQEISDSINYAFRIQKAILPPDYYVKECLPESFIFYCPKDVVSGDFYYVEQTGDHVIFSAVDCTGHGVPGAMMSVIGYNLINQAVKLNGITQASKILEFLDMGVTKTLRQFENESGVQDGMDLGLCSLNMKTRELQYAGAYNPLVYIHKGELYEIKADKFPIGVNYDGVVDNYTNHNIQLEKGDVIYLYSDGYADQFGGPRNKKFKYKPLKQMLLDIHRKHMPEQREILDKTIKEWQGGNKQIDDILLIGVRV